MADKMLIDASHEEETCVVVVRGNRIEEFDFESQHKKQLRGNIYLAKVTRVEPSLQAAFVDYGGNRHGFLAFSEIHPDYYQIPLADREALMREAVEDDDGEDGEPASLSEPAEASAEAAAESEQPKPRTRRARAKSRAKKSDDGDKAADTATEAAADDNTPEGSADGASEAAPEAAEAPKKPKPRRKSRTAKAKEADAVANAEDGEAIASPEGDGSTDDTSGGPTHMNADIDADVVSEDLDDDDDDTVESVGAEDAMEEVPEHALRKIRKQYRIQEVIKRRQILLVQVAKEERGNKGAALTTYLSLAGRYSVLMPNTARGGGISRKITNPADRKRLKDVAKGLEVPQGMGVILRTAGANRTKAEVKRDFEYLMRLWENVRTKTLTSTAPCLVYEEGSLIKRSIRDLYNKDISEVIVSGDEGYREAKDFMKMLMPSHAKVVQRYRDIHPIYSRSGIEAQLDRMLQPQVTLKSGGYLIINQTEALVAIDVNSGRSTREHSIEDTALQTNLEAAEEVARQLRLRDLAGLVVIDFIDMEEKRNNRAVEKKLKECLKNDRARIQVGRISHFGLLEMSRQRIRASVLESTTQVCSHCGGTGHVLSQSSVALHVLRGVEEYLLKNTTHCITVRTTPDTALYLLNQKRHTIVDYETRFGLQITIASDAELESVHFEIDRGDAVAEPVKIETLFAFEDEPEEPVQPEQEASDQASDDEDNGDSNGDGDEEQNRSKRRRRRRRGRGNNQQASENDSQSQDDESDDDGDNTSSNADGSSDKPRRKRRRGKRGGRRNRGDENNDQQTAENSDSGDAAQDQEPSQDNAETASAASEEKTVEATVDTSPDAKAEVTETQEDASNAEAAVNTSSEETTEGEAMAEIEGRKPRRRRKPKAKVDAEATAVEEKTEVPKAFEEPASAFVDEEKADVEEAVTAKATADPASADDTAEAAAESDDEEATSKRANRASNVVSSEPKVTSNGDNNEEPPKPKRGWWNRGGFF